MPATWAESEQFEEQGLFPAGSAERVHQHLRAADSIEIAVADVDFIEEAVSEVPAVKHEVLRRISAAARPDAIIGSNTSTIPVHVMEEAVVDPRRFLTVHWSNPAPFIPGVDLVTGCQTDPAVLPVVNDMLERAGRSSAIVADVPGFVLNRLQYVLLKEAMSIVEEGVATADDVDTIVRSTFGFRRAFRSQVPAVNSEVQGVALPGLQHDEVGARVEGVRRAGHRLHGDAAAAEEFT